MHPAKSVIFFTTISGAGFGLIALLALTAGMGHISWDKSWELAAVGLGLSISGLISSVFHLAIRSGPGGLLRNGNPAGCRVKACWR